LRIVKRLREVHRAETVKGGRLSHALDGRDLPVRCRLAISALTFWSPEWIVTHERRRSLAPG